MRWLPRGLAALLAVPLLLASEARPAATRRLKIGVTLLPYYSWTANVVGGAADVVPALPAGTDPHTYQPKPEDLASLQSLDAIVVNGLGHDEFIDPMLQAAGRASLPRIRPNEALPLMPVSGEPGATAKNSHSFIAITGAIQQTQTIARSLGRLDPRNDALYARNAAAYAGRLRALLAGALSRLDGVDTSKVRVATVHDGYAYLFRELGLTVAAVVQPRHGLEPSARQLADTIDRIRKAGVGVLFIEMDLKSTYVDTIFRETGCRVLRLSHMAGGAYTADAFERDMKANLDAIVAGVTGKT